MNLKTAEDILQLNEGRTLPRGELHKLIISSKKEGSAHWAGPEFIIGNTPMQGINWIGMLPHLKAVMLRTRLDSYGADGWTEETKKDTYRYSFKAKDGAINLQETANRVLISQPQFQYPILLFTGQTSGWRFEGRFIVSAIEDNHVMLRRVTEPEFSGTSAQDDQSFQEGGKIYVTHLLAERSKQVVSYLKSIQRWICEICGLDFAEAYGVKYIEAHHKVAISSYGDGQGTRTSDLALPVPIAIGRPTLT